MDTENLPGLENELKPFEMSDEELHKQYVSPALIAIRYLLYTARVVITDVEAPVWVHFQWVPNISVQNSILPLINNVFADYYDSSNRVEEIVYRLGIRKRCTEMLIVPVGIEHIAVRTRALPTSEVTRATKLLITEICNRNSELDHSHYGRVLAPENR